MASMSSVDQVETDLRDFARLQVYAGLTDDEQRRSDLADAIRAQLPRQASNADVLARAWLASASAEHVVAARSWIRPTDTDRLDAALAECSEHDVLVLPGVASEEAAIGSAKERDGLRGALWFSEGEVWHAVDHGELTLTVWAADPAARAALMTAVATCVTNHGLRVLGRTGDGLRISCWWQRQP